MRSGRRGQTRGSHNSQVPDVALFFGGVGGSHCDASKLSKSSLPRPRSPPVSLVLNLSVRHDAAPSLASLWDMPPSLPDSGTRHNVASHLRRPWFVFSFFHFPDHSPSLAGAQGPPLAHSRMHLLPVFSLTSSRTHPLPAYFWDALLLCPSGLSFLFISFLFSTDHFLSLTSALGPPLTGGSPFS